MIQMIPFHGWAVNGQQACNKATQRANAALAVLNITPEQLLGRDIQYVSSGPSGQSDGSSECVITLTLQTDVPFSQEFLQELQDKCIDHNQTINPPDEEPPFEETDYEQAWLEDQEIQNDFLADRDAF